MPLRVTKHHLHQLENVFAESDYILRYEKGNFRAGHCILKDQKVVLVNKYYSLEGKITTLIDILSQIGPQMQGLKPATQSFLSKTLAQYREA